MGRVYEVDSYEEFKAAISEGRGFVLAAWDGSAATEARVKEETSATTRVLHGDMPGDNVKCLFTGEPAKYRAYFAASY
jgi:prolyl-tRNA synthetase